MFSVMSRFSGGSSVINGLDMHPEGQAVGDFPSLWGCQREVDISLVLRSTEQDLDGCQEPMLQSTIQRGAGWAWLKCQRLLTAGGPPPNPGLMPLEFT